jgi:hypothetical protein
MRTAPTKIALFAVASVALAVLAVVAWQCSRSTVDSDVRAAAPSAPAPSEPQNGERETLEPLVLANVSAPTASPLAPEAQRVEVSDDPFDEQHFATVVLMGRIESSRRDLALAQIDVKPNWPGTGINERRNTVRHRTVQARADGTFELDVTQLIQGRKLGRIALEISVLVTHPMLASAEETVRVPTEARLQRERRIELPLVVRMPWGTATLRGQVRTVDGAPAAFKVAAFQMYDHVHIANAADSIIGVPEDGGYRLEVHADAEYAIVVFADGYRPGTLRANASAGTAVTMPLTMLTRGEKIRGRVLPGSVSSAVGATVSAEIAGDVARIAVAGSVLAWCGDAFEWGPRVTSVDLRGDYEFAQLGPRAYKLVVNGIRGSYLEREPSIEVGAPSIGADISIGNACEVRLKFFQDGKPAVVYFAVDQQRSDHGQMFAAQNSGKDGRATLFVDPGTPTSIVFMDRDAERTLAIPACTGGPVDLRVDL